MKAFLGSLGSFFLTVSMLVVSLLVLHESHNYSKSLIQHSKQISMLSVLCPLLSILSYMSPITAVIWMVKNGDESQFPVIVILAQALQNIACGAYGLQISDDPFFLSSAIGLVFQLIWLTLYYSVGRRRYTESIPDLHPIGFSTLVASSMIGLVFLLSLMNTNIVGMLSTILTTLLCISPLATLGIVVRSRNSATIPIPMSLVMLVTNIAWGIYGILLSDNYIFFPSLIGVIITVFQLIVTAWCNGVLFYNLTFLQVIFGTYQSLDVSPHRVRSPASIFGTISDDPDRID
jgi:solute carrier family 50 protein (sugar transporter)